MDYVLIEWLIDWLFDLVIDCSIDWLIDWLFDWLKMALMLGPKSVSVQTTRRLNDNEWHSVLLERNRLEIRLRVDGSFSAAVPTSDETFRPLQLNGRLIVGAALDLSSGFVGCLRTLMVNGIMFDLRYLVQRGTYGIVAGCVGKCDSGPCFNGGVCQERYDQYRCDCRFTAFRGPLCSDGINREDF